MQLTSFHQSWFYCVATAPLPIQTLPGQNPLPSSTPLRSITTALFASQVWSLFSAPTFFIPVFLIFLFCRRPAFSIISTSCLLFHPSKAYVFFKNKTIINSIIRSFTRLLTLSLAYLTVNENPPIILFPLNSFQGALVPLHHPCSSVHSAVLPGLSHTHTTCSLEN